MVKIVLMLLLLLYNNVCAVDNDVRARNLFDKIKCPTCLGQAVKESNAPASEQIKSFIAQSIENGLSDEDIILELKRSFGDQITFDPGFTSVSALLWLAPLMLVCALLVLFRKKLTISNI